MYSDAEMTLRKDALIAALEFVRERDVKHQEVLLAAEDFYKFLSGNEEATVYQRKTEDPAKTEKPKRAPKKQAAPEPAPEEESDDVEGEAEEPADSSTLTTKEVIDVLRQMLSKADNDVLKRILKHFGAARASDLEEKHYRTVFDIAQAVLIEDDTEAVLKKYGVK